MQASLTSLIELLTALDIESIGVLFTILFPTWVLWQFYAPILLGRETVLQPWFKVPNRIAAVEERTVTLRECVEDIDQKQVHLIQVTRANSRALDPEEDVDISSGDVDDYLLENDVPVAEFTVDQSNTHHADD